VHAGPDAAELEAALAASAVTVTGTWQTARVTHAQLETHGSIGWLDDDGRLVLRSSTQVPFLARDEIAHIFGLDRDRVRVHTARLGGGFGGKQEMFTEDLVALAVLRTGRPVAFEFSRADEFQRAAVRHPMRVTVTLGADADGRLTAMAIDLLSDTGAYGNHSRGVMFHSLAESTTIYRVPLKRLDAEVVYTNNVPSGAFRGYGLGQVVLGVESAMDQLSERLGIDPFELRRRNAVTPQDDPGHDDLVWGSYGFDQCLDLAESALRRGNGVRRLQDGSSARGRGGDDRHDGALRPHRAHERDPPRRRHVPAAAGTAEFGNGTTTVLRQIAVTDLCADPDGIELWHADTDAVAHDTGAFASAGITVAGKALHAACLALAARLRARAAELTGTDAAAARLMPDGVYTPVRVVPWRADGGRRAHRRRQRAGEHRSLAFNVHAVRVAVDPAPVSSASCSRSSRRMPDS
jgi:CO/xanthine dehydrogenase Mo-binding subunit